jgi:hypothetical protein
VKINRGLVFWGVALISAGAVALAIQGDVIDGDAAREMWRFWPVVLILIGLAIIAARTPFALPITLVSGLLIGGLVGTLVSGWPDALSIGCGGETDKNTSANGTFGSSASVELEFDCGDLAVAMGAGDAWDVDAGYAGDTEPEISSDAGRLRVRSEGGGFPGFSEFRQDWSLVLPRDVTLQLDVEANASSSHLDLTDGDFSNLSLDGNAGSMVLELGGATIEDLTISANAGSVSMNVDAGTSLSGSISANAGSLELCVPDGVGVAIVIEDSNITFSHNLDESGLDRSGDTWRTPGGGTVVFLNVSGNAASFTYNPEDGCS